jgi:hypothetical protein
MVRSGFRKLPRRSDRAGDDVSVWAQLVHGVVNYYTQSSTMWLIEAKTYKLRYFQTASIPYTILSHTWAEEEVLFADLQNLEEARKKAGWQKIEFICRQTIKDGLEWTWVDTCCIDKSSSAELSEAINSMFTWYQTAEECHVYLADYAADLGDCRWWSRGWV